MVLKAGGLYWWMAIEDAGDPKKLVKEMLKAGPSKWASCHGQVIAKLSSSCLINDQFTPAALAVLGGFYREETHIDRQPQVECSIVTSVTHFKVPMRYMNSLI